MAFKDTLTLYEELVDTGIPETQAKIIAHQHGAVGASIVEFRNEIRESFATMDKRLDVSLMKIDSKLDVMTANIFWLKLIGGIMTIIFSTYLLGPLFKLAGH